MPISKHPLFPAMVALWFAALFGLGSLAIRPTLLEKFVLALRLDLVVPAAAPPLGFTSRILLALLMFVIGAAIGFVVARKLAHSGSGKGQARTAPAKPAKYQAGVADDEDFDRLSAARPLHANPMPGRRRALAMEEDYVNDYRDHAPVPGHEPQILDLATLGGLTEIAPEQEFASAEEPIAAEPVQPEPQQPTFDPWNRHTLEAAPLQSQDAEPQIEAAVAKLTQAHRTFNLPAEPARAFAEPQNAQPMNFHRPTFAAPEEPAIETPELATEAPQFQARAFDPAPVPRAFDPAPEPSPQTAPFAAPATAPQVASTPLSAPAPAGLGLMPRDAVEMLTSAPLASLGVVQLAERLALAIARRKSPGEEVSTVALSAAFAAPASAVVQQEFAAPEPQTAVEAHEEVEAAPEEVIEVAEVAEVAPARFAEPAPIAAPAIPRAMRPLSFDDSDDGDYELESILPPRRFAMPAPTPAPAAPEPVAAAPAEQEENFASLLGMKPSLRQSFVRVEEPVEPEAPVEPVVIFPGQAPRFASPSRPFEAPAQPAPKAEASPEPTPIEAGRRFDAPSPKTFSAHPPAPSIDPEETERALKAALATLQRMSGAA